MVSVSARRERGWTSHEKREFLKGMLFLMPWLIGFLLFMAYPILASLGYSFTYYDLLRAPRFIGLANYRDIFFKDEQIGKVLYNTLYFVVVGVPAGVVVSFLLAVLLNQKLVGRSAFRTVFYIPSIVPIVSSAMVWLWVLNPQYGLIDGTLKSWGLPTLPFLTSQAWAKPSLVLIHCWSSGGAMIIFLAALQDVPRSLYDAARVDGAGTWAQFRHITIPMCTPAILFNLLTGIIGAFQYFAVAWLLTQGQGGPNGATEFYALYLYRNAFRWMKMGYASALAWILFLIVISVTLLTFRSSARWVYYAGTSE